ncbi:MAG: hypothetical protein A3K83_00790 [Omnitrophica WOR_2 bacterium RBG_13_44_8b]|nr:MAG: hypothetical protein A3K83_00790 [Omnitrophica WOR_2 bacterium RBG_13_44_8b]
MARKGKILLISALITAIFTFEGWLVLKHPKIETSSFKPRLTEERPAPMPNAGTGSLLPVAESIETALEKELQLELLGTAIGNTKDPIAFIKDLESNKQGMYRLGSQIKGAQVVKIVLGEVTLERSGKREILKMSRRARSWAGIDDSIILSRSQDAITVSRQGLINQASRILNQLPSLKFKPHYEGKKAVGLMVDGISDDSIIREAGIRNRDVIKTVNGQTVNSYQQALQVAAKARNQSEISVNILREGKVQNISYRFAQ